MNYGNMLNLRILSIIVITVTVLAIQLSYVTSGYADSDGKTAVVESKEKSTAFKNWRSAKTGTPHITMGMVKTKIQAAVDAGKITQEQADQKLQALSEKFEK